MLGAPHQDAPHAPQRRFITHPANSADISTPFASSGNPKPKSRNSNDYVRRHPGAANVSRVLMLTNPFFHDPLLGAPLPVEISHCAGAVPQRCSRSSDPAIQRSSSPCSERARQSRDLHCCHLDYIDYLSIDMSLLSCAKHYAFLTRIHPPPCAFLLATCKLSLVALSCSLV